jgi:hypothetical protein
MRRVLLKTISLLLFIPIGLTAGVWPKSKGEGFLSLSFGRYQTVRGTQSDGTIFQYSDGGKFVGDRITLYGEHGLGDNVTLHGSLVYTLTHYRWSGGEQVNNGFPDQEIGLSYAFTTYPVAVAISATYYFPLLYSLDGQPLLGFRQHAAQVAVGAGVGFRIGEWASWASADAGYRRFFGSASDQIHSSALVGSQLSEEWSVIVQVLATHSPNPKQILQSLNPNIVSGYSVLKTSGLVMYAFNPSVSLVGNYIRDVWGKRSGFGDYVALGVWLRY